MIAAAAVVAGGLTCVANALATPHQPGTQLVAVLHSSHVVLTSPEGHRSIIPWVRSRRPITGSRTILPVIARTRSAAGTRWLRVLLPGRPNGDAGWIRQQGTALSTTRWRVVVQTRSRRLLVFHGGRLAGSLSAIVGRPSTPTPRGRFFVEESVRMPQGAAGAPFALALSARSDALRHFEGGPGQIAIHGTARLRGALGTASSHGCVRLAGPAVAWLAANVPAGAPVRIV